jgi:hypothetical protein
MEVLMWKTKRRRPQFDCLEGKLLLSAAAGHHEAAKPVVLTGSLSGLPNGKPGVDGYTETTFPVSGHVSSMGKVSGSFSLEDAFIPIGKLPDLNGASLTLENTKGSVLLTIAQTKKNEYKYTVISGTDDYASAAGKGTITVSSPAEALNLTIKVHTTTTSKKA